jgi:hypothetical protein
VPSTQQLRQFGKVRRHLPHMVRLNGRSCRFTDEHIRPLRRATRTIPIVFAMAGDPVDLGIVDGLARPGGNATGFFGAGVAVITRPWAASRWSRS